jgi:hypothetical protein
VSASGQPFNPRLVIGLIAAGIAGFIALLLLVAFGGSLGAGRDGRAHALSVSAVGYKGLVDLVGEFRETGLIRRREDHNTENLVVIALEERSRPADLEQILARRRGRATLIILPKWLTQPLPARRGWVQAMAPIAGQSASRLLGAKVEVGVLSDAHRDFASGEDLLNGLRLRVPRQPQYVHGGNLMPLVRLPGAVDDAALVARIGDQPHYLVADPDLLNNHGLKDPATARAALDLVERLNSTGAQGVDFELSVNGIGDAGAQSLLRLAFEPPFLVMTLALLAAALLAGLHGAFRFGPTRREPRAIALGKAALVENSAGLIRLAEREARLGGAYAEVVRQDMARTTGAPHWLQGDELDRYLNRLGKTGQRSFSELAADLHLARDRHGLMAAAKKLFQWKKEIIR